MALWLHGESLAHWMNECAVVFGASLLHEDVAVVTGGLFVTEHGFPFLLALASLFVGVVAGDLLIYGIGALARRSTWLRRRVIGPHVQRVGQWLDRNLVRVVAVCKVTPGLLFPTYVAYGWFRISFLRFAGATAAAAAVYSAVALGVVTLFGHALLTRLGYGAWAVLGAAVLLLTFIGAQRPNKWRRVALAATAPVPRPAELIRRFRTIPAAAHRGMPSLAALTRRIAKAERIPPPLFYIPIVARWLALGARYRSFTLPTAANPRIEGGGFWGESKCAVLRQIGADQQRWVAPFVALRRSAGADSAAADERAALAAAREAGLEFPLVVKPDVGWQGFGVRVLHHADELCPYLEAYPAGETCLLQRLVPWDGEAGVFYVRRPGEERGRIYSITLRYFPFVVGDGRTPLRDLILRDARAGWKADFYLGVRPMHMGVSPEELTEVPPAGQAVRLAFIGSLRVGGLYRDGTSYATPALEARFDAIARSMPEFHYGRFDIRFASLERLQQGEDFAVFEVNGAGSEAIQIWDPSLRLTDVYRILFEAQSLLFEFGDRNRRRGFRPVSLREFFRLQSRQHALIPRYPPSE